MKESVGGISDSIRISTYKVGLYEKIQPIVSSFSLKVSSGDVSQGKSSFIWIIHQLYGGNGVNTCFYRWNVVENY